jgi:hypothetical protein
LKIKLLISIFGLIVLLSLLGCMNEEGSDTDNNEITGEESPKDTLQTPPNLTISVGEEIVRLVRGTYSWSYNNGDGTSTGINADSGTPPNLVENQKLVDVTPNTEVRLNFETQPTNYQVMIWDTNNNIKGTYDEVVLSEYNGKVIYEVLAQWEQGTVSYAFSLNVKE